MQQQYPRQMFNPRPRINNISSIPSQPVMIPEPSSISCSQKDGTHFAPPVESSAINMGQVETIHRLKSGQNSGFHQVNVEVYDETVGKFVSVPGILDSGSHFNVAPMSFYKYCTEPLVMVKPRFFSTPTGEIIQAEKYGVLKTKLVTSEGSLPLGKCRTYFMGGN